MPAHRMVYVCVLLICLTGLGFIGHLSWKECLRLLVIQAGLAVLYFRYRGRLTDTGRHRGAVLAALCTVFVLTQFDPATSAVTFRTPQPRLNVFFVITTLLSCCMVGVFWFRGVRSFGLADLTLSDRVVAGVVLGVLLISAGSGLLVGEGLSGQDALAGVKMVSYLLVWFPVTRMYASGAEAGGVLPDRWRGTFLGVSLLFGVALVSGGYRTGAVLYHYGEGQRLFDAEEWEAAIAHYETARNLNTRVDLGPIRDRYLSDLATLYLRREEAQAAQETIARLREMTYGAGKADLKVGDVYARAALWPQAAEAYRAALEKTGKDSEVLDRLGRVYVRMGDRQAFFRMAEAYQYVPRVDAQTYEQHVFLGDVQTYREDFRAAEEHFKIAASFKPEDAYSVYRVGRALLEQGRVEAAAAQFEKAAALDPGFADAYYRLGVCYEAQGRVEAARGMYEKAVAVLPNHLDGLVALARVMRPGQGP